MFQHPASINSCSIDIDAGKRRQREELERKALEAQANLPESVAAISAELEQTRKEFADYKAQQRIEHEQEHLEHAKVHKEERRRSWAQVIVTLFLSPLITLFIEHHEDVLSWLRSLFH